MKENIIITLLAAAVLSSYGEYNKLLKSTDYEYKYEAAKNHFAEGQYNRSATLLNELTTILKGTDKAEGSLYVLAVGYYNQKDYSAAAQSSITYFNTYPHGQLSELARFRAGEALYLDTPESRLDRSSTYQAVQQLQMFLECYPQSNRKQEAQDTVFALQDKLILRELLLAGLYYNLGDYLGNNSMSCMITARNALKGYPYTDYREELPILILRTKYEMAVSSVEDKKMDRYRETVDRYHAFKNEFPESKYLKRAEKIFKDSQEVIRDQIMNELMDYKKANAPTNTITHDTMDLCTDTGNVYETVAIIGKRANQINVEIRDDLSKKLAEFASYNDNLEKVSENREQIEISRYYEELPKPDLAAAQEYVEEKIYCRNPAEEKEKLQ